MASKKLVAPELAVVRVSGMTRQAFLLRSTLAAGAVVGASAATPYITRAIAQDGGGDVEILNFALTLEYLETAYYEQGLERVDGLDSAIEDLATEIRDNEQEHVDALRKTIEDLGGQPAEEPEFDFGEAFASRDSFLQTANTLEDTGVSAYNGAAPNIMSKEVLAAAGGIVQVEARHAALIRLVRNKPPAPLAFDEASEGDAVLEKVMPFIVS